MSFEIASESTSGESAKFVEESVLSNLQSSGLSPPICQSKRPLWLIDKMIYLIIMQPQRMQPSNAKKDFF